MRLHTETLSTICRTLLPLIPGATSEISMPQRSLAHQAMERSSRKKKHGSDRRIGTALVLFVSQGLQRGGAAATATLRHHSHSFHQPELVALRLQ
jgi:hypothetical protein